MAECVKIRTKHRKPCIGEMRWRIDIYNPTITPPNLTDEVDYTVTIEPEATVWATVKTLPNVSFFDDMNVEQVVSHEFIIRYREGISREKNIRYPSGTGQYYNIVYSENLENRNEFILMRCNLKGSETHV